MSISDQELKKYLSNLKALPFLFVGSGLTQRYLGSFTWEELLKYFSALANDNSKISYAMYTDKASRCKEKSGLLPKIAEYIETDFNSKWFNDDKFISNREKHINEIKEGGSPFKIEIASVFQNISRKEFKHEYANELQLFKNLGKRSLAGILTTNYDTMIENIFKDYKYTTFIGQEELIFSPIQGIGEIYKIHGCCTKHNSIIINDVDYEKFNQKNAYLVAKLLTIFLEHPIIFIGYSINDRNIRDILSSIAMCLTKENLEKLSERFIFIQWNNSEQEDFITRYEFSNLNEDKSLIMTKIFIKDFGRVYESLLENKATYNPRVIRKLKEDVYNIVLSSKPSKSIKVLVDIDDKRLDEMEAVVGFSLIEKLGYKGYEGIDAIDLFKDVIYNCGYEGNALISDQVVEKSLPKILRYNQSVPMHKYLKDYSKELNPKITTYLKNNYEQYLDNSIRKDLQREIVKEKSISELIKNYNLLSCLKLIPRLKKKYIDKVELHQFITDVIKQYPDILTNTKQNYQTDIRRLIKIYDFLEYYNEKEA